MPPEKSNYRLPETVFISPNYEQITAAHSAFIESQRGHFSDSFTGKRSEVHMSELDNLDKVIRVFETLGRILIKNEDNNMCRLSECPRDFADDAYKKIRIAIPKLIDVGIINSKVLNELLDGLDSIVITTSDEKISNVVLVWNDPSRYNEELDDEDISNRN